jgi:magnesium transporter
MSAEPHADMVEDVVDEEFVALDGDVFVGEAIEQFRGFVPGDDETTIYYVYVRGNDDRLIGILSLRELLNAPEDELVASIMYENVLSLDADEDVELAAQRIRDLDYPALPVTDAENRLVGVVRTDDMVGVVEEEATEDILKSAGFSFSDTEVSRSSAILESSIPRILRLRLPWLFVALAGGLFAGTVIEAYEDTVEAVVALAFFVPVVMDMGATSVHRPRPFLYAVSRSAISTITTPSTTSRVRGWSVCSSVSSSAESGRAWHTSGR